MSKFVTKHSMKSGTRTKVSKILQQHLADAIDLQIQSKVAHWNVKGPRFFFLHGLFDEIYSKLTDVIDSTAERIATLGSLTTANVQNVAKSTRLKPYPTDISAGLQHVDALSDALALFAKNTRESIDKLGELEDVGSEDLLTGQLQVVEQYLWFLEAHLQDDTVSPKDLK